MQVIRRVETRVPPFARPTQLLREKRTRERRQRDK